MKIQILNARIVDPVNKRDEKGDLFAENGVIVEKLSGEADLTIDAAGKLLSPGLIDTHTHLREPGGEYKEDIESGTAAAAAGGYTAVAPMPNTSPTIDNAALVEFLLAKAEKVGSCKLLPIGAVTKDRKGEILAEIGLMKEAGAVALSDDGVSVKTAGMLKKAMLYANNFDLTIIDHCEDPTLTEDGAMNEGLTSTLYGLRGIPSAGEDVIVARDILMSRYLDIPIHIAHVSTKMSYLMVKMAKEAGLKVSAEVCPHHFAMNCEKCSTYDSNYKMYPPLREEEDRLAMIEGLKEGVFDCIATDHAPHHNDEKELEFSLAANGILGLESAFPLSYTILCKENGMSLTDLLEKFINGPSALFRLDHQGLKPGAEASFAIFDLENEFTFDKNESKSKSRNTPYHGMKMFGRPVFTCCEGRVTHDLLSK